MEPRQLGPVEPAEASGDGQIADASSSIPRPDKDTRDSARPSVHPALTRLSGVLARDAADFARRHRYAGLGRLQLIWNQLVLERDE
jgi:hypothetical protein